MRILLTLLIALTATAGCPSGADAQTTEAQNVRQRINWDDGWKFHLGQQPATPKDFRYGLDLIFAKTGDAGRTAAAIRFNDSAWEEVRLPHDWAATLPFAYKNDGDLEGHGYRPTGPLFPESNVGWYRKAFSVAKTDSGKRFIITFDGIFRDSRIWINGFYLGNNLGGYSNVSYDITDFLHYGQKNVLAVRADASQYEGWFYEGAGIYRHVWLEEYNDLHLAQEGGVFVHTEDGKDGVNVIVEATVANKSLQPATGTAVAYITTREGQVVATTDEQTWQTGVDGKKSVMLRTALTMPHRWNLDDPYLYRAVVQIKQNGQVIDSQKVKFGIRTITIDKDKGLFVNGKPVKIQGVCCHQDHAGCGGSPTGLPPILSHCVAEGDGHERLPHQPQPPDPGTAGCMRQPGDAGAG